MSVNPTPGALAVGASGAFVLEGFEAFEFGTPVVGVAPAPPLAVTAPEFVSVGEPVLTVAVIGVWLLPPATH
ncbi:MAG TPA: hypothetical protein VNY70_09505, partial [Steroidobacteraceae bacterium]|nr:hypothetical protein [Steroidobacteraceae bacterium]